MRYIIPSFFSGLILLFILFIESISLIDSFKEVYPAGTHSEFWGIADGLRRELYPFLISFLLSSLLTILFLYASIDIKLSYALSLLLLTLSLFYCLNSILIPSLNETILNNPPAETSLELKHTIEIFIFPILAITFCFLLTFITFLIVKFLKNQN